MFRRNQILMPPLDRSQQQLGLQKNKKCHHKNVIRRNQETIEREGDNGKYRDTRIREGKEMLHHQCYKKDA